MDLKGTVSRIFMEKDNGFKILVLEVHGVQNIPNDKCNPEYPGSVTVVGMMKGVEVDYVVEVSGDWEYRPKGSHWPWQFKTRNVSVCEYETPVLLRGILAGLPSVGPAVAGQIIRTYPNVCDVIEKTPKRLTGIQGVTEQKALLISEEFKQEKEKRSLGQFLKRYGMKNEEISEIAGYYGSAAMSRIRENPYCLCEDRFASFKFADRIGKDLGMKADAQCRLRCAMNHVLLVKAGAKGHVYLTQQMLLEEANKFFHENAVMAGTFSAEQLSGRLRAMTENGALICEEGKYYHPERYRNECDVAEILLRRSKCASRFSKVSDEAITDCLLRAQEEKGIVLDDLQREAVIAAVKNSTIVLTGGPGSGKTTLLNVFVRTIEFVADRLEQERPNVALAAPTGMASKRMTASTGLEARTIHKLFDIRYDFPAKRESDAFLLSDVLVIDEMSMLDIDVMAVVLRAISDSTSVILVGDVDQIQSIGPGNVLSDIIHSGVLPVIRLKGSYRQSNRKTILSNAMKINAGDEMLSTNRSDFVFIKVPDSPADRECKRLKQMVERVFCEEFLSGGRDLYRIQVISPVRSKTQASVDALNLALQKIADPLISPREQLAYGGVMLRRGDKLMQVRNNYDKGIYNGDIGIVKEVSVAKKKLLVDFQGTEVEYQENELDQLKHAYATTVHKVQGGEYPVVIMVVTNYHAAMLLRSILYTGVTRAQQKLIIIGDENAVRFAIRNTKNVKRLTALEQRLRQ